MKSTREQLNIIDAYQHLGSYRGAAQLCGVSDRTVKRVLERQRAGGPWQRPPRRVGKNTDTVLGVIEAKVRATDGRISAKRLLAPVRAAGYSGSARNLRRAVALVKTDWRRRRRSYRPWLPTPGECLAVDWTPVEDNLEMFCAVLCWSRYRFVRFARDQKLVTTLSLLAECFEELGGVPLKVLTDRMGCLKAGVVANQVVPQQDYLRFAAHFGFQPDFCEAADPESKGVVENLCGYAQRDLVVPAGGFSSPELGNQAVLGWGAEVNGRVHSETQAVPQARLEEERQSMRPLPSLRPALRRGELRKVDRLQSVRFASARYSLPEQLVGQQVEVRVEGREVVIERDGQEVIRHQLMGPGEASILDEHYPRHARRPVRAVRAKTATEVSFLGIGEAAKRFLRAAAAAGTARLASELAQILSLEASWGRAPLVAALERATRFRRFRAQDVRAILAAGEGAPNPTPAGEPLKLELPAVPVRQLSDYALEMLR
ncbi:MAG: IS21 family transposase [Candidatus Dormibacteria bacterium]